MKIKGILSPCLFNLHAEYIMRNAGLEDVTPWTAARQASLAMKFPRREYWSGLPFPSPEDLPDSGIEHMSPTLHAYSLLLSH